MKKITLNLTAILCFCFVVNAQQYGQDIAEASNDILSISIPELSPTPNSNTSTNEIIVEEAQLRWESNGADLNATAPETIVNLSADISPILSTNSTYTTMLRTWRIEELGGEIPMVNISIPQDSIISTSSLGNYYMFISESDNFNIISDYRIMSLDENGNLKTQYDFNNTTFITFGFAPQISEERSIYFNGNSNYIDVGNRLNLNPSGFTISAWVKPNATENRKVSILSKRDAAFTNGYTLSLNNNKVRIFWKNGSNQSLMSQTTLPNNEWHHIAVTYDGYLASIFIDGILDSSAYLSPPIDNNESFLIAAAGKQAPVKHFEGNLDEIRIWNTSLTKEQLRYIMNQKIIEDSGFTTGKELPLTITKNDISPIPWSALAAYYPMSHFTYKDIIDSSGNKNDGKLISLMSVARETAPIPYTSAQNGDWQDTTSWSNGDLQYKPGATSIVDSEKTIDWNIVNISHNIDMNNDDLPITKANNRTLLGLTLNDAELTLIGDTETLTGNGLTITHYLNLDGKIDLEGESQLIQTLNSDLETTINGQLERDQQGTADTFTYNYWSSPVVLQNSNSYSVSQVMMDGTHPNNPNPINFLSSGYNGTATSPIGIADYWIWKFANQVTNTYSAWQHVRKTGHIFAGEGFTMKGPGTGTISSLQNYVFRGKPNNGDISLIVNTNNDYLVGNPYPSAIDANLFIRDNGPELLNDNSPDPDSTPLISGTLYFWDHWGGDSHLLSEYQGGYASYNYSGAVAAASFGSDNPDIGSGGIPVKKPRRYIPVGQGFFIAGKSTGVINFNNGQRVFKKEDGYNSIFMGPYDYSGSNPETEVTEIDERMKFRIGFNSVNTVRRQLLLTIDENASPNIDWAYDAKMIENQMDDMFWMIGDEKHIIQGSNEAEVSTVYPIGIKVSSDGLNIITIDDLKNVPSDVNIYVHDIALDTYHDLRSSDYTFFLNAGEYLNRFEITFSNTADILSIDDAVKQDINVLYSNDKGKIVLINPNFIEVKSIELFNMIGQSIHVLNEISENDYSEYDVENLTTGTYIIKLHTISGLVVTKKVLVK